MPHWLWLVCEGAVEKFSNFLPAQHYEKSPFHLETTAVSYATTSKETPEDDSSLANQITQIL